MSEELKVSDLIDLKQEDYIQTHLIIKELKSLSKEYHEMSDFYDHFVLENLKRKFDDKMQDFASYYAKIKKFKGAQHVYLDEIRKKIKSEALEILMSEGIKSTAASELVYKHPYYTSRIKLMEDIKEFMINTELMYERFDTTFQSIVQSIGVAKKEFENSKK